MKRLPGKSAREVEDDAKSESSTSQVLSHEERQAQYEKTRARIFSDYVESQVDSKGSDDAGSESPSPPLPKDFLGKIMLICGGRFFNEEREIFAPIRLFSNTTAVCEGECVVGV
jgi:hypothetical protein